jgi:hypothetical protein
MRIRWIVNAVLLVALSTGCRSRSKQLDPWYRLPPQEATDRQSWSTLDEARIHEVIAERQEEAQALLEEVALLELTEGQAAAYIGRALPDVPGTQPYLVRGLYRFGGNTGRFFVVYRGEQLIVHHGAMGSGQPPPRRRALVLQLERKPSEVYVYATAAR